MSGDDAQATGTGAEKALADAADESPGPGRRIAILGLVLSLCLLAGVIGWRIAQPSDESFNAVDVGFLSDMRDHHNSAISLAFEYLPNGEDQLVGHFAREIIVTQAQENVVMNGILTEAGNPPSTTDDIAMDWMGMAVPLGHMPGIPSDADLAQLRASSGIAADDLFTKLMINHHASGVEMAEYAATHGENARVKRLATAMAQVQRTEIAEMNTRRKELGFPAIEPTFDSMAASTHSDS